MSTLSQFAGAGLKSVQRGTFGAAGSVTITSVNTGKTVVLSVSKGSAGTVAASANVSIQSTLGYGGSTPNASSGSGVPLMPMTGALSGGTTSGLFSGQYSAVLTNATTLTADGACQYQVIEYY
jgi:hypothetical protein